MFHWENQILLDDLLRKNIISLDRGRVISSIDLQNTPGIYPVYSSSAQKNGFFGAYGKFDFDEELITWSVDGGGYFFYRPKHKFSVTNVSGILRILKKEKFDYKFLYYILDYQHKNQIFDYVDKAHPSVIKKRYFIPDLLLSEQQTIASVLSKLDEAITQTETLIAKYSRIKTGLMQDLLTKGIDENGNIRSEETHDFKDSPLGRIPKEWDFDSVSNLCTDIFLGLTSKVDYVEQAGYPLIRATDVNEGVLSFENALFISEQQHKKLTKYRKAKKGDVLITKSGTLGICAIVDTEREFSIYESIIVLQPNLAKLQSEYLLWLLRNKPTQDDLLGAQVGSTVGHLNIIQFRELVVAVPKIAEQEKIAHVITKSSNTLNDFETQLRKLKMLKAALMQDLLSGKVRVNSITPNPSAS